MASSNKKTNQEPIYTAGGSKAVRVSNEANLRRSVMAHMLFEKNFYEEGESVTDRIKNLIPKIDPKVVSDIAIEARTLGKLRHVPLFIASEMAKLDSHKGYVRHTLANIINRADELAEFLAIYWNGKKTPVSAQVKKGLADAFAKFSPFQLQKYNRDKDIKLRDVMFLCHPKPKSSEQGDFWKKLANKEYMTPIETWETLISACGSDSVKKREVYTRLLSEKKMGALAVLRNLRNFQECGVSEDIIKKGILEMNTEMVLPFRFIEAVKYAPRYESQLETAMMKCLADIPKIKGKTIFIVDVSGSMGSILSGKSNLTRYDAAIALAILAREMFEDVVIYATAGSDSRCVHATTLVPARHGFALGDAIRATNREIGGGGIFLNQVMDYVKEKEKTAVRTIVLTDEQDCDHKANPANADAFGDVNYLINIACQKNGIANTAKWNKIDGFSEACLSYIAVAENFGN